MINNFEEGGGRNQFRNITSAFKIPIFMLKKDCCHVLYFKQQPYTIQSLQYFSFVFLLFSREKYCLHILVCFFWNIILYGIESILDVYLYIYFLSYTQSYEVYIVSLSYWQLINFALDGYILLYYMHNVFLVY